MLSVIAFVLALYLVARLVWPLRLSLPLRGLLALLVVALALHHRIVASFAGSMASPEIPRMAIATLASGFTALLLCACFVLLIDLAQLLAWMLRRHAVLAWLRRPVVRGSAALLALLLGIHGVSQGMATPGTRSIDVQIAGLPPAFDGYRVVQLTDIHASRLLTGPWVSRVVERSNGLHPDLVVITGDLIDGDVQARRDDVASLGTLRARDGVIAITGNHEYYAQHAQWMQAFRGLGMHVLENTHTRIERAGSGLTIAGVTDPVAARYGLPMPDVAAALRGADPSAPVILLDHRPGQAVANAGHGVALQLSGHTHGGHIIGMDQLVKRANGGFVSGRYEVGGMTLYVSNGAGLWPGFAARIGVPSEITLITLRAAPAR